MNTSKSFRGLLTAMFILVLSAELAFSQFGALNPGAILQQELYRSQLQQNAPYLFRPFEEEDMAPRKPQVVITRDNSARMQLDEAIQEFQKGNYAAVIARANNALRMEPDNAQAYAVRAAGYLFSNQPQAAEQDAEKALQLNPTLTGAYLVRSGVALKNRDYGTAISDSEHALLTEPNSSEAYVLRSAARYFTNDLSGSMNDARQAANINPNAARAWFIEGKIFERQGNAAESQKRYEQAVKAFHNLGDVRSAQLVQEVMNTGNRIP